MNIPEYITYFSDEENLTDDNLSTGSCCSSSKEDSKTSGGGILPWENNSDQYSTDSTPFCRSTSYDDIPVNKPRETNTLLGNEPGRRVSCPPKFPQRQASMPTDSTDSISGDKTSERSGNGVNFVDRDDDSHLLFDSSIEISSPCISRWDSADDHVITNACPVSHDGCSCGSNGSIDYEESERHSNHQPKIPLRQISTLSDFEKDGNDSTVRTGSQSFSENAKTPRWDNSDHQEATTNKVPMHDEHREDEEKVEFKSENLAGRRRVASFPPRFPERQGSMLKAVMGLISIEKSGKNEQKGTAPNVTDSNLRRKVLGHEPSAEASAKFQQQTRFASLRLLPITFQLFLRLSNCRAIAASLKTGR